MAIAWPWVRARRAGRGGGVAAARVWPPAAARRGRPAHARVRAAPALVLGRQRGPQAAAGGLPGRAARARGLAGLNASGFLETYDWFGADAGGVAAAAAMYTGLLHDSAFVPCPAGRSAEQFRIWEALVRVPPAAHCKALCTTCSHGG